MLGHASPRRSRQTEQTRNSQNIKAGHSRPAALVVRRLSNCCAALAQIEQTARALSETTQRRTLGVISPVFWVRVDRTSQFSPAIWLLALKLPSFGLATLARSFFGFARRVLSYRLLFPFSGSDPDNFPPQGKVHAIKYPSNFDLHM